MLSIKKYIEDLKAVRNSLTTATDSTDMDLLRPAANVVFLTVIAIWLLAIIIFILLHFFRPPIEELTASYNVVSALLSGLALGAIVLSLFIQRAELKTSLNEMRKTTKALREQSQYLKYERDRNVREFSASFQSERLKEARKTLYILRAPFFKSIGFRKALADQWVGSEDVDLDENWVNFIEEANSGRVTKSVASQAGNNIWHISDLINYYVTLFQHCESLDKSDRKGIARAFGRQYIWAYWRGMLLLHAYEVAKLYDERIIDEEQQKQFPKPYWIQAIFQFDLWVMEHSYRPNIHPRETKYSHELIEFDNDYLKRFSEITDSE